MIELFKNSVHKIFYIRQYNKMMDNNKENYNFNKIESRIIFNNNFFDK